MLGGYKEIPSPVSVLSRDAEASFLASSAASPTAAACTAASSSLLAKACSLSAAASSSAPLQLSAKAEVSAREEATVSLSPEVREACSSRLSLMSSASIAQS